MSPLRATGNEREDSEDNRPPGTYPRLPDYVKDIWEGKGLEFFPEGGNKTIWRPYFLLQANMTQETQATG